MTQEDYELFSPAVIFFTGVAKTFSISEKLQAAFIVQAVYATES